MSRERDGVVRFFVISSIIVALMAVAWFTVPFLMLIPLLLAGTVIFPLLATFFGQGCVETAEAGVWWSYCDPIAEQAHVVLSFVLIFLLLLSIVYLPFVILRLLTMAREVFGQKPIV